MAEKRISELTAKGATLGATDLLEISEPDGLGGYVSKRVTGSEVFAGVSTSNFASANLTFTANRTHNLNTYGVALTNGVMSVGDAINANARLQGVTNTAGMVALRGYHYGSGGEAIVGSADGANAIAIKGTASGTGAIAGKFVGYYALGLSGRILDETQSTTPAMPQDVVANEATLLASLGQGQWYYLDNADGTGTVKVKL